MGEFIKQSEAKRGELVTTVSEHGGIGLGRVVGGRLYVSGGNGFYYAKPNLLYRLDGGADYREAVSGLAVPPTYRLMKGQTIDELTD